MTTPTFPLGDLDAVLTHLAAADPGGELPRCGIRRVLLGRDRTSRVADVVDQLLADRALRVRPDGDTRARVTLIVDATTIRRGAVDLKAEVEGQLAGRFVVHTAVLRDEHPVLHADEHAIEAASRAAEGADAVVSVGGGTITDISKLASEAAGHLPFVAVQTAASVDGFTDDVSVILRSGVKRTVPSRWPDAVIADVEVISQAPETMNRAGFGEILSMFTAPADWKLAAELGVDRSFREAPTRLLAAVGEGMADWSPGVAAGDVDSVERLTWALAVRGIVTGISGTTACLSGVEHLISHMLDLHHGEHALPMGLHGAQVGAASVIAAAAWEMLFDRLAAERPAVIVPDEQTARARVTEAFAPVDPSGRIAAECWADYSRKLSAFAAQREHVEQALAEWPQLAPRLRPLLRSSAEIAEHLRRAHAPARLEELEPSIAPELARWAVTNSALMRNRFTVVDLLTFLGWWQEDDIDELLHRVDVVAPSDLSGKPR
jgi:glycerol-1-phosphate dehydrogenase [NAD(P)+]